MKNFQNCEPDDDNDKAIPWTAVLTLAVKNLKSNNVYSILAQITPIARLEITNQARLIILKFT